VQDCCGLATVSATYLFYLQGGAVLFSLSRFSYLSRSCIKTCHGRGY